MSILPLFILASCLFKMKRHSSLQTLSRQHHNGLLAVLLLRKGTQKNADGHVMNRFINDFFQQDLDEHFMLEEKHLLPLMTGCPELVAHADQIATEHKMLYSLKELVQSDPSNKNIAAFASLLEKHIRYEERTAFPEVEKHLPEPELLAVGKILAHHDDKNCMAYPVKFWE
jgi:hemerythrin-like domain-containing protein